MKKAHTGFTLIELMVVLAIGGILLTLAVPSFDSIMRRNRLTTDANNLIASLNLARSEAISHRRLITVCTSSDQSTCTGSDWAAGWVVRDNTTNEVIRVFGPMKGNPTITSAVDTVQFTAAGLLSGGAAISINICTKTGEEGRQVNITATGRANNVTPYPIC